MDTATINQQLRELYQPYLNHLYAQDWSNYSGVSAPLLMHVFDDYVNMPRKVMIVGQETHTWAGGMHEQHGLSHILRVYEEFKLGLRHVNKNGKTCILPSQFWNFSRSIFHGLNAGISKHTPGFLWTNISKFDDRGTTPAQTLQNQNEHGFALLKEEIRITKPDIVVFLIGGKYYSRIKQVFGEIEQRPLIDDELWQISAGDTALPLMFLAEHPTTLCRSKMNRPVLDALLKNARLN